MSIQETMDIRRRLAKLEEEAERSRALIEELRAEKCRKRAVSEKRKRTGSDTSESA